MTLFEHTKERFPKTHQRMKQILDNGKGGFEWDGHYYVYHSIKENGASTDWGAFVRTDGYTRVDLVNQLDHSSYELFVTNGQCSEGIQNQNLHLIPDFVKQQIIALVS